MGLEGFLHWAEEQAAQDLLIHPGCRGGTSCQTGGLDDGWCTPLLSDFNLLLKMSRSSQLPSAQPKIIAFLLHCFEFVSSKCLICALA